MQARTELRVALSITVALVAVGCGSDPNRTLDSFRSATYGYTIEHPSDWTVVAAARQLQDGEPPRTGGGGTDIFARHASHESAGDGPAGPRRRRATNNGHNTHR